MLESCADIPAWTQADAQKWWGLHRPEMIGGKAPLEAGSQTWQATYSGAFKIDDSQRRRPVLLVDNRNDRLYLRKIHYAIKALYGKDVERVGKGGDLKR